MKDLLARFATDGVLVVPPDAPLSAWARAAKAALHERLAVADPNDWRHGGTWFAGVDALENTSNGSIGGTPLAGTALDVLSNLGLTPAAWHRAQLSVVRQGYPGIDPTETPGAARFRRTRDAAHVDGLLPIGPKRRRMLREPHAVIFGVALTDADPGASPLVVWPGSHHSIGAALGEALAPHDPASWPDVDLTDTYTQVRREVFATCARRTVPLQPGAAVLLHRHVLHGIAPWADGASAAALGRATAYFRPLTTDIAAWAPDRTPDAAVKATPS